jgi:chromosome segregation ATPase
LSQAGGVENAAPAGRDLPVSLKARLHQRKTEKLLADASLQLEATAAELQAERARSAGLEAEVQRLGEELLLSQTHAVELSCAASAVCEKSNELAVTLATVRSRADTMERAAKKFHYDVGVARFELADKERELRRARDRVDDLEGEMDAGLKMLAEDADSDIRMLQGEVIVHELSRALRVTVTVDPAIQGGKARISGRKCSASAMSTLARARGALLR